MSGAQTHTPGSPRRVSKGLSSRGLLRSPDDSNSSMQLIGKNSLLHPRPPPRALPLVHKLPLESPLLQSFFLVTPSPHWHHQPKQTQRGWLVPRVTPEAVACICLSRSKCSSPAQVHLPSALPATTHASLREPEGYVGFPASLSQFWGKAYTGLYNPRVGCFCRATWITRGPTGDRKGSSITGKVLSPKQSLTQ